MSAESLRRQLYAQLHGRPGESGLSPLNWLLAIVIVASVAAAIAVTEPEVATRYGPILARIETAVGLIFILEYFARIWIAAERPGTASPSKKRIGFMLSPMGLIDLVVIIATLTPIIASDLVILRVIRLLRLLTLAKLGRFSRAFGHLFAATYERRFELLVTIVLAVILVLFGATALYLAEGEHQPDKFGSIPRALWWSVITLTTVGYGDVSPVTPLGKVLASLVAIAGIGLVAMPTGILAAAFSDAMQRRRMSDEAAGQ